MKGSLYVVATPIGNLSDITFRAVEILSKAAFILAEDTRYTAKLLNNYKITTSLISYRDQNHERMIEKILEKLNMGLDLALVTDSGTPLISDPGYRLVSVLKEKDYSVVSIPGPSAAVAALSVSGLPTDKYVFLGFLPKQPSHRKEILMKYGNLDATIVIYESPARVLKLLEEVEIYLGERIVCFAKDISKLREEVRTGYVSEMLQYLKSKDAVKGEYVVLISKKAKVEAKEEAKENKF